MTITPSGDTPIRREGFALSIFQKQPDGRWLLARDANLLAVRA
jgi:ketosteroid isomerase-like protein